MNADFSYWIKELLVIFLADVFAGLLLYKLLEGRLEERNERSRKTQFKLLASTSIVALMNWLSRNKVSIGQMSLSEKQREIPFFGIDKIFDPSSDWNFKGVFEPLAPLHTIYSSILEWNAANSKSVQSFTIFTDSLNKEIQKVSPLVMNISKAANAPETN